MLSSVLRHGYQKIIHTQCMRADISHFKCDRIRRMSVITLSDLDAVKKFIQLNSKCCIYYTADWCGPCQKIKPIYKGLAATYDGKIALGMVNVDDNPSAAAEAKVVSIPTFSFYNDKRRIQKIAGADPSNLRDALTDLERRK
jgi:thioredoxin 1